MTTTFSVIGIMCLILAVGAIDGGYNGLPVNDNWTMFIICLTFMIISGIITLLTMKEGQ